MNNGTLLEKKVEIALKNSDVYISKLHEEKNKWGINLSKTPCDFIGHIKGTGQAVYFDCKSTDLKSLPLKNLKEHQNQALKQVKKEGAISFLFVMFRKEKRYFMANLDIVEKRSNKSSISIKDFEEYGIEIKDLKDLEKNIKNW